MKLPRSFVVALSLEALLLFAWIVFAIVDVVTGLAAFRAAHALEYGAWTVAPMLLWAWTWLVARHVRSERRALWMIPRVLAALVGVAVVGIATFFGVLMAFFSLSGGPPPSAIFTAAAVILLGVLLVVAEICVVAGAVAALRSPAAAPSSP